MPLIEIPIEQNPQAENPQLKTFFPEPVCFSDVSEEDLNPNSELIRNCLYRGAKMLISAPSKARKSWLLLDLCAAIANGRDWLGFHTERTPTLFVNLELFTFSANKRLHSICEVRKYRDHKGIHLWHLRGEEVSFATLRPQLKDYCLEHDIGFVALDPYYRLGEGQDENDNGAIAKFLMTVGNVAKDLNVAVAMTHHFSKGNSAIKNAIDRMSGAGVFARDPDVLMSITEQRDSDSSKAIFVAEMFLRDFAPVKPFAVRWDHPVWHRDDTLSVDLKGSPGRPKAAGGVEEILGLIKPGECVSVKDLKNAASANFGICHRRFYEIINEAIESDKLIREKEGRRSFYKLNPSHAFQNNNETHEVRKQGELEAIG